MSMPDYQTSESLGMTMVEPGPPLADVRAQRGQAPAGQSVYKAPSIDYQDLLKVLKKATRELFQARTGYERAAEYYNGLSPEVFSDPRLRRLLGLQEDVYNLNYAAIPVNCMAQRLSITAITVPGNAVATKALQDLWTANKMAQEANAFITDVLKYGDSYYQVWPVDGPNGRVVKMIPQNPMTTRVMYDPEDSRTPIYALKSWDEPGDNPRHPDKRADLYFPTFVAKFISTNNGKHWDQLPEADGSWPMDNPFGVVPFFHFRAGAAFPYGQPEHAAAYGTQDALVKIAQTAMGVLEYVGYPARYALLAESDASGSAEFSDLDTDAPDSFLTDTDGRTSGLRQGPGELWTMRAQSVGQFTAAPLEGYIAMWNQAVGAMSAVTATPLRFFTDYGGEQHPSGDALRSADRPLHEKIKTRMLTLTAAYQDKLSFALSLSGITIPPDGISIQWRSLDLADDKDAMNNAEVKLRCGVPIYQVYLDLGYSPAEVDAWDLPPEAKHATPPQLWASSAAAVVLAGGENTTVAGIKPPPAPPGAPPVKPGMPAPGSPEAADMMKEGGNSG